MSQSQNEVDVFVQDASGSLVIPRMVENLFAPINRVPPEVLSIIPDYCRRSELVGLTHVCRRWREIFISRASLWAFLDCMSLDQTRSYLRRSKTSPLEIRLNKECAHHEAFLLTIPHVRRLKALTLTGSSCGILSLTKHLVSPASLLEKLAIYVTDDHAATIKDTLFDGDFRSLRMLLLSGVITELPWKNLSNLTTFYLHQISEDKISVTRLLDFFEHAPLLGSVTLQDSLPDVSDAPPQRVVPLPHLRSLSITAEPTHSILLNHLYIPTGASIILRFQYDPRSSPFTDYLPRFFDNLTNISHIISVDLHFDSGLCLQLEGPSGYLCMTGTMDFLLPVAEQIILRSLDRLPISTTERLAIAQCNASTRLETGETAAYQTLLLMNDIRTLTLTNCLNPSFVLALNPNRNASNTVVCPRLEELVLYTQEPPDKSCTEELLEMARERASRGAKLSTFVIGCVQELDPTDKVFGLKNYVSHVEHRRDENILIWWD